jgi:hypothetical protein
MTITEDIRILENILKKGKMNDNTRYAIKEIVKALKKGDDELAYELSAFKSQITGVINEDDDHTFQEDMDYNKSIFGRDIYSLVDTIHHNLSYGGRLPSGMQAFTLNGVYEKQPSKIKHPIITMIEEEHKKTVNRKFKF